MRRLRSSVLLLIACLALALFGPVAGTAQAASLGLDRFAAPPVAGIGQATVAVPVLNVRTGPGTGYGVAGRVTRGTPLTVQSQNGRGDWLEVVAPGSLTGWVSAGLVSRAPAAPPGSPTRIVAPSIGLDARVVPAGWHDVRNSDGSTSAEWDVPSYAAGWLTSSALPGQTGNTVLAGHHNIAGEVFRYVVNLKVGDTVTLYADDRALNYQVVDKFILPDKYVSYAQRVQNARWIGTFPDERVTLVTCWPYTNNTHRVIVIARPVTGG